MKRSLLLVAFLSFALTPLRAEDVTVPGATIEVRFLSDTSPKLREVARQWVSRSAGAIAGYYGKLPVPHATLRISLIAGHEVKAGEASGWRGGPQIVIELGRSATAADLADEWTLPHEFLHLGFPSVAEEHHWLEEGMATYCESVARARAGLITPERAWNDLFEGLPQGQPERGDRGLDHTPTWGRTYWGGALFCLRADVEIRRRTGNRVGFEDALRALAAAGGSIEHEWPIDRVISIADHATGVPVWRELYDEMKDHPKVVDLESLWRQLGVVRAGKGVRLDDSAPLAATRRAILYAPK